MWIADNWKDYEVLDTSSGEKLERWGDYFLVRPDPQVIWNTPKAIIIEVTRVGDSGIFLICLNSGPLITRI